MIFAFVIDVFTSLLASYVCSNRLKITRIFVCSQWWIKIEACAVEYLYQTRDREFAKMLVTSTNHELSSIAYAVVENPLK